MKRIKILLAATVFSMNIVNAQDVFINIDELPSMTYEDISLGTKSSVTFISNDNRFIINSSNHGDVIMPAELRNDGRYAYRVEADLSEGKDRTFTVKRAGTALQAEKKKYLNAGESIFFEIKEAEHRIVLNKQVTRDILYPVADKACLVFTSPIPNTQLRFSDKIGAKLSRKSEEGGVEVLSLEIDIPLINALKSQADNAQKAYDLFEVQADAAEIFTDEMVEEEKRLEEQLNATAQALSEALTISLYSEKSNEVYIDKADMQSLSPKMKIQYGVLDIFTKVGTTPFAQKLIDANQAFITRRYKEAAALYEEVGNDPEATINDKANCEARAKTMIKCAETRNEANRALQIIQQYKKQGDDINPDKLVDLFNVAINQNEQLFIMTNDEYFQDRANSLKISRDKIGLVIRGTVLSTRVKQGIVREEPLIGIDIYGVTTPYFTEDLQQGVHGDYLGSVTANNGSFQIQIPRNTYKGLLFIPTNNSSYKKNVWQGLGDNHHSELKVRFKK